MRHNLHTCDFSIFAGVVAPKLHNFAFFIGELNIKVRENKSSPPFCCTHLESAARQSQIHPSWPNSLHTTNKSNPTPRPHQHPQATDKHDLFTLKTLVRLSPTLSDPSGTVVCSVATESISIDNACENNACTLQKLQNQPTTSNTTNSTDSHHQAICNPDNIRRTGFYIYRRALHPSRPSATLQRHSICLS